MTTIKQACSDIINSLKSYTLDDRISFRFIKNLLFDKAAVFIKQDSEMRRLQKIGDLWKPLGCIDFEDYSYNNCVELGCSNLKRSTIKIPEAYQTAYGYSIKLFNINYTKEFNIIQPYMYKDIANRPYKTKSGYFWIENGKIIIPDSDIETGTVLGMFKEGLNTGDCYKPLDSIFSFPDYIISITKQEVLKELLGTNKSIVPDDKPNLSQNDKKINMPTKGTELACGKRHSILSTKVFNSFLKTHKDVKMDYKTFVDICDSTNLVIAESIKKEPLGFKLPYFGNICVTRFKSEKIIADPVASKLFGKHVPFANIHTLGYRFSIRFFKFTDSKRMNHIYIYKYKADRKLKRGLAALLKSTGGDQFLTLKTNHFVTKTALSKYTLNK